MKTVVITGTSKGIGLETALAFGRAGYKVFATMRNPNNADDFRQKINEESLDITISAMDVDSAESVNQAFAEIYKETKVIDVLVNNAGIEVNGSIEEMPMTEFSAVMETNYFGVLRCTKAVLTQMRTSANGCIINISSVAGHISNTPLSAYAASKHAVEAVSEGLAQELKPYNVRVAIVEPGIINTQMSANIKKAQESIYPQVRRFGGLFAASLKTPTPPTLVADKILEIAESDTLQLRHPVGPDALPFLGWRASMTDEQWTDWNAMADEDWYNAVLNTFGLDAHINT